MKIVWWIFRFLFWLVVYLYSFSMFVKFVGLNTIEFSERIITNSIYILSLLGAIIQSSYGLLYKPIKNLLLGFFIIPLCIIYFIKILNYTIGVVTFYEFPLINIESQLFIIIFWLIYSAIAYLLGVFSPQFNTNDYTVNDNGEYEFNAFLEKKNKLNQSN